MKKIWLLAMALALTAISAFAGGVAVGNGKQVYRSPYGVSVEYQNGLTVRETSQETFTISNEALVKNGEPASHVEFTVTGSATLTPADLATLAQSENPGRHFEPASQPGAQGLASEIQDGAGLRGVYYFLTSNHDLVRIQLTAFAAANGLSWVAPIVHTLTYDVTPPVAQAIRVDTTAWPAGSKQRLHFQATDDNSGISGFGAWGTFSSLPDGNPDSKTSFFSFADLRPEGGDWYALDFDLNRYLTPGDYALTLSFSDRAGNWRTLNAPDSGGGTYEQKGGPALPVLIVHVANDGPSETTRGQYLGNRLEHGVWSAGTSERIFFRLADPISGIQASSLGCLGLVSDFRIDGQKFYVPHCQAPREEGQGWYSLAVALGQYLPAGRYHLQGFSFANNAGIGTYYDDNGGDDFYRSDAGPEHLPLIRVEVRNAGVADTKPPTLSAIRIDSTTWTTGQTYRFHFRASDELSGVATGKPGDANELHGYFVPTEPNSTLPAIYLDHPIEAEGNGWYGMDVPVGAYQKGGEYYLNRFSFADGAGNWTEVSCDPANGGTVCTNSNGNPLSSLKITVVR